MKYEQLNALKEEGFRRLTGVKRATFHSMIEILTHTKKEQKYRGGRKKKLCTEDQLLMALEYLREYRTYFHVATNYGISESSAFKCIRWIEDTLIKHPDFALPGRKALLKSDMEYSLVLIDATESPIERPKKNSGTFILERKKDTR